MKTPFAWPQSLSNENEVTNVEPRAVEFSQVEEREMYIGSRRSSAKRREMEDLYRGSVQDIKEGCMIAVLATDDPRQYPFWIAKAMKVNKENEEVVSVEVHWYATDTHPFDGVYKAEMVVEKKVCRKRNRKGQKINRRRIDILKLEEVDILVYDFKLTKKDTLRSKTIEIIKRLLPQPEVARWESVKPSRRSRRNMTSEMMGIDVDSDGAPIDNREEYGSSTSSSSPSSAENVDSDGVSESMDEFEEAV